MVKPGLFAMAASIAGALLLAACASPEATPAAGPSAGQASLQSPPFSEPKFVAPPGQPTRHTPAPATALPAETAAPAPQETEAADFSTIASQFDPARQHFVWVLPPGVHGKGPWDFRSVVKHKDEVQFETSIPLRAEILAGGARPEYPAGYEVVRLTDDGQWARHTAEIDKVIQDLIAKHGRGQGSLEMFNELAVTIDPAHQKTYCVDNKQPDVRFFMEEDGVAELIRLDVAAMAGIIQLAVQKACDN